MEGSDPLHSLFFGRCLACHTGLWRTRSAHQLDEVVGQRHILGPDGLLRRIIESGNIPTWSLRPSGTGKTTVANLIAARTNRTLRRINATTGSLSDVKDVLSDVGTMLAPNGILLYLDEIQYFNKKQQQSLLEVIENGGRHPHRLHHGEPLFLRLQRRAQPVHRL